MLERIVCDFYQTILCDESLNIFYIENVSEISDLHHLVEDFFAMLFGGPNKYKGRNMYEAHKHMPIERKHYEGVWNHMKASFKKNGASEELIEQIRPIVWSFENEIITKK